MTDAQPVSSSGGDDDPDIGHVLSPEGWDQVLTARDQWILDNGEQPDDPDRVYPVTT